MCRLCSKKGFQPPPTWQVILVSREVTDARKVPGQVKRRPLENHGPILSLDPLGGNAEGTEGGNSDSLHVEEKGRAEVLRLEEELKVAPSTDGASGPAVPSATAQKWESFGKELPSALPPSALQKRGPAVRAEAASWNPEACRACDQPHIRGAVIACMREAHWYLTGIVGVNTLLSVEGKSPCVPRPKARGLPSPPSRQVARRRRPTLRSRSCSWT